MRAILLLLAIPMGSCERKEHIVGANSGTAKQSVANTDTSQKTDPLAGIATEFVAAAVLTPDEQRTLVELAGKCGVSKVAKIRTYYVHPSRKIGIEIKSEDTIRGREVSFVTVRLQYKGPWIEEPAEVIVASVGQFMVRKADIRTKKLTTCTTPSGTIRIRLDEGFPIDLAD
jgi:hypothetical protein